jgi:hypothetical protein
MSDRHVNAEIHEGGDVFVRTREVRRECDKPYETAASSLPSLELLQ